MKFTVRLTSGQEIHCDVRSCSNLSDVAKELKLNRYVVTTIQGKELLYLIDKIELIQEV